MDMQEEKVSTNCRSWAWLFVPIRCLLCAILMITFAGQPARSQEESEVSRWSVKKLVEFQQRHHPNLRAQDVWKLFYQATFGVEHILSDSSEVAAYLLNELAPIDSVVAGELLIERISLENDLVRVNLRPFRDLNLSSPLLVKAMFQSARETIPDTMLFYRLWNEFSALVRFGLLKFPLADLKVWDEKVGGGTIEAVHHSTEYVSSNRPAYRVVRRTVFEEAFGRKR